MKRILIIEDNRTTLEVLANIVKNIDNNAIVYAVDNVKEAYSIALEFDINLFMVDIILDPKTSGDSSGIDFVTRIRDIKKYSFAPVIFITALEDPKLYGYSKLHCYGYIEKPFNWEQVQALVNECLTFPDLTQPPVTLLFKKQGVIYPVESTDIVYVESGCHHLTVQRTNDALLIPHMPLKQVKEKLEGCDFIQCHRNTIINRNYIESIDMINSYIGLKSNYGTKEIGRTYKPKIKELFSIQMNAHLHRHTPSQSDTQNGPAK